MKGVVADDNTVTGPKMKRCEGFEVFIGRIPMTCVKADLKSLAAPYNPIHDRMLRRDDSDYLFGSPKHFCIQFFLQNKYPIDQFVVCFP